MRILVTVSPQFDLCFALADLVSPNPHFDGWPGLEDTPAWIAEARSFGWVFWLGLPDLVESTRPTSSTAEFVAALRAVPEDEILPRLQRSLVDQPTSRFPNAQVREWLHFIGLDEGEGDPHWGERWNGPMDAPLAILNAFRPHFEQVWNALQTELESSAELTAELIAKEDLDSLSAALELGVEFDRRGGVMRTARGYKLPLADVGTIYLLPSIFNSRRFKTLSEYAQPRTLYLPYLLEDVPLPGKLRRTADFGVDVDPWRVCRALGNPTRAAILRLIADRPRPAFEVQKELALSKANVSHHIFELREAGLITEKRTGRTVELSVRLQALRGLTRSLTRELGGRRRR